MKSASAYYLLLIYLTAICKPVLPVAKDTVAHLFWKTQHLRTVHHEHGKDHLHYELINAANEITADHEPGAKCSEPVSIHILSMTTYDFSDVSNNESEYPEGLYILLNPIMEMNIPPPKV